MKILSQINYTIAGFQSILERTGNVWEWWPSDKAAFDIFDEYQPDLVFTTDKPPKGFHKRLEESPIPWIEIGENQSVVHYDGIKATRELPSLVDPLTFRPVPPNPKFSCDISYIGPVNPTMLKLCHPVGKFNIKIGGPESWPVVQYLGDMTPEQARTLYASSTLIYVETVEEALRAAACKKTFVTLNEQVDKIFNATLGLYPIRFVSQNYDELIKYITEYINNPTETSMYGEILYDEAIPKHTYMKYLVGLLTDTEQNDVKRTVIEYIDEHFPTNN